MYKSHITGKIGEKIAQEYLIKNDYEILVKNFRCKQGEIDIIAKDKNELVFIEVKTSNWCCDIYKKKTYYKHN